MPEQNNEAKFIYTTRENFNLITKNSDSLYFVLETTGEISMFLGENLINEKWLVGANLYNEIQIGLYNNNDLIEVSDLDGYQFIRAELYIDSVTSTGSSSEIYTTIFKKNDILQKSFSTKVWSKSDESNWNLGTQTYDGIIVESIEELINILNNDHPANLENADNMARGNNGSIPTTYYYAKVNEIALTRNVFVDLKNNGKIESINNTQLRFIAPSISGISYKLRLIGVSW